jgi:succinyl-diaminopimelate desuccinylase
MRCHTNNDPLEIKTHLEGVFGIELTSFKVSDAVFHPLTSPLVQCLSKIYKEATKDNKSKPLAIGGGTYAKEAPNTIAFGPMKQGVNYHMHGDNEFMSKAEFLSLIEIYSKGILTLTYLP